MINSQLSNFRQLISSDASRIRAIIGRKGYETLFLPDKIYEEAVSGGTTERVEIHHRGTLIPAGAESVFENSHNCFLDDLLCHLLLLATPDNDVSVEYPASD